MHPQNGGRLLLTLQQVGQASACYVVTLYEPREQWSGQAEVRFGDGQVDFTGLDAAAPWLCDLTRMILRTTWRNSESEGWPRRIQRWRPAPNGAS